MKDKKEVTTILPIDVYREFSSLVKSEGMNPSVFLRVQIFRYLKEKNECG